MPVHFTHCLLSFALMASLVVGQFLLSLSVYGDQSMSVMDNIKRVHLIKNLTQNPQNLNKMAGDNIAMILRTPSLARYENNVVAWHYHGESCSLDIYFSDNQARPDYIEYRPLTLNEGISAQFQSTAQSDLNYNCLKDVLNSQGVSTPENYARQPIPSWDSPYRS